jgi:kinesin light chain
MGLEESGVMIALYDHFNRMESDRSILRLEMNRVMDENDWLRDELSETQRR